MPAAPGRKRARTRKTATASSEFAPCRSGGAPGRAAYSVGWPGGRVEPGRLVASASALQDPSEPVVDPEVIGMIALGLAERPTRAGPGCPGSRQSSPTRADRPQFARSSPSRPGLHRLPATAFPVEDEGGLESLRHWSGSAARAASARRAAPARCPGSLLRRPPTSHPVLPRAPPRRRAGSLDQGPSLGRRRADDVDPGVAEGVGIGGIGGRAIRVVGLGRADVDDLIE